MIYVLIYFLVIVVTFLIIMRFYPYEFKTTVTNTKRNCYGGCVEYPKTEWNDKYQCEIALKEDTLSNDYICWFFAVFPLYLIYLFCKWIRYSLLYFFQSSLKREKRIKEQIKDQEQVLENLNKEIEKAKKELNSC